MKICWDTLERVRYNPKTGTFRYNNVTTYYEHSSCIMCGDPYLGLINSVSCGYSCRARTEEVKAKISAAMIGENSYWFGKTFTEEHRMNLSMAHIGNIHTEEHKAKISIANSADKHWNWQGGISYETYCSVWTDKEYKYWIVNDRDGRCFGPECNGKHIDKLMPHHINYNKRDCEPSNLIALCRSCNSKANKDREWHEAWYTVLMIKRGLK